MLKVESWLCFLHVSKTKSFWWYSCIYWMSETKTLETFLRTPPLEHWFFCETSNRPLQIQLVTYNVVLIGFLFYWYSFPKAKNVMGDHCDFKESRVILLSQYFAHCNFVDFDTHLHQWSQCICKVTKEDLQRSICPIHLAQNTSLSVSFTWSNPVSSTVTPTDFETNMKRNGRQSKLAPL